MKGLAKRIDETDLLWQLRLSNIIVAQERLILTQRQTINLLMEGRTEFDLSADERPALLRPQA